MHPVNRSEKKTQGLGLRHGRRTQRNARRLLVEFAAGCLGQQHGQHPGIERMHGRRDVEIGEEIEIVDDTPVDDDRMRAVVGHQIAAVRGEMRMVFVVDVHLLPRVGRAMRTDALVMSIAAGYGIAAIREGIGRDAGIIRIMPNVNANVCASTTGYATSASITAAQLDAFHFAFGKIGELIELDEGEFETFSAIAGCGVAYVYMFIDAMARAGLRNGLSKQKALSIAASAVMGSAKLVSESGMHPYALIDSVTTPGGTTIEGVLTLQRCGFESAVHAAIQASIDKELGMK